jgi:hypothetical protein
MSHRDKTPTQRVWRLAALMAGAMVAAVVALHSFPPPPTLACPSDAAVDATYAARLEPRPHSGVQDYEVSFLHRGEPEVGFKFCLRAAMDGMADMAVTARPRLLGPPGRLRINFEMAGGWSGEVLLLRPDGPTVAVPVHLLVA